MDLHIKTSILKHIESQYKSILTVNRGKLGSVGNLEIIIESKSEKIELENPSWKEISSTYTRAGNKSTITLNYK